MDQAQQRLFSGALDDLEAFPQAHRFTEAAVGSRHAACLPLLATRRRWPRPRSHVWRTPPWDRAQPKGGTAKAVAWKLRLVPSGVGHPRPLLRPLRHGFGGEAGRDVGWPARCICPNLPLTPHPRLLWGDSTGRGAHLWAVSAARAPGSAGRGRGFAPFHGPFLVPPEPPPPRSHGEGLRRLWWAPTRTALKGQSSFFCSVKDRP